MTAPVVAAQLDVPGTLRFCHLAETQSITFTSARPLNAYDPRIRQFAVKYVFLKLTIVWAEAPPWDFGPMVFRLA